MRRAVPSPATATAAVGVSGKVPGVATITEVPEETSAPSAPSRNVVTTKVYVRPFVRPSISTVCGKLAARSTCRSSPPSIELQEIWYLASCRSPVNDSVTDALPAVAVRVSTLPTMLRGVTGSDCADSSPPFGAAAVTACTAKV